MAKCQFCNGEVREWDSKRAGYLIASTNENGDGNYHTHVHGSLDDKNVLEDLIDASIKEGGLTDLYRQKFGGQKAPLEGIKEIVFHNRQRIGDMLMFTCGVRDFKKAFPQIRINVISTCSHIWDHNPSIDRTIPADEFKAKFLKLEAALPEDERKKKNVYEVGPGQLFVKVGPSGLTNASNRIDWHFANAFRVSMEENLGIHIPQGESRPDIWLTEDEYNAPRITERPYWIIVTGGEKGWGCKMYPTVKWQEVIDQNPDILFYQIGAKGDNHVRLTGKNVVDYIGKTEDRHNGIRDLFKLFLNAEGSIGLVSFHMHLSGALKKPCVVVAGAREPVSFTRYAGHQYIATDGTLPCAVTACWHCDIKACTNPVTVGGEIVPKCVDMIEAEEVSRYLNRYYKGGRLDKNKVSEKPKLTNLVKTPRLVVSAPTVPVDNPYGLPFGGGSLTERDWEFISNTIDEYKVESVIEFGAGLSTLLLNDKVKNVVTYEDKQAWIDKMISIKPSCLIQPWDGKSDVPIRRIDMAFVDGPAGDIGREHSTRIASELARIVIVHDAGREWARKYQETYLVPGFDGPVKGGHRCHRWIRKDNKVVSIPRHTAKKTIKFVSTARGWGGCARSITTLMKLLTNDGHSVEFIPFRNSVGSAEFRECLKGDLSKVKLTTSYDTIGDPCDVLFMYADDYIWELGKPEIGDVFSRIKADRKIMTLNYRRGAVGQAAWTKGWDEYLFLNRQQEKELLNLLPGVKTKVLAPCTDLSKFLSQTPSFKDMIRIVRHSSQGDTKYDGTFNFEVDSLLVKRKDLSISLMPAPSFLAKNPRVIAHAKNTPPVHEFLSTGNLFWYSLPEGYMDMGPRVILEAMAVGLPIIADNWGGAVDRVTPECGWLLDKKEDHAAIIKDITLSELEKKGAASKERARTEFVPERWMQEIIG